MCLALCVMMILSFMRGGLGLHGKAQKLTGCWGTMQLPGRQLGAVGMLLCKVAAVGTGRRMEVHEGGQIHQRVRRTTLEDKLQLWIVKEK